jgi:hypothetical protein
MLLYLSLLGCSNSGKSSVLIEHDSGIEDSAVIGTEPESTGQPESEPESSINSHSVSFISPTSQSQFEAGESITFLAEVVNVPEDSGPYTVVWESTVDGVIHEEQLDDVSSLTWNTSNLSKGVHTIYLYVTSSTDEVAVATVLVGVCGWDLLDDFETEINTTNWLLHRDAYRDGRGWLEMTGNAQGKKGAIFNIGQELQPGNLKIKFDISTGQCDEPDVACSPFTCDADGFAVSVYKTNTAVELEALLENTSTGGGLGYAYSGTTCSIDTDCPAGTTCENGECATQSFHIEFDTWYNESSDPTQEDHIGIMLNGDQSTHHLYTEIANLEDNMWHEIIVQIQGTSVETWMDGTSIISGSIPPLNFKGGFIGFTGTTGSCINYHRFDNLYVQPTCNF